MRPCKAKGVIGLVALQEELAFIYTYFFHLSVKRGHRAPAQAHNQLPGLVDSMSFHGHHGL